MDYSEINRLTQREMDALTWQYFYSRPGDRQVDSEGYWSARMGVRMVFPRYSLDAAALHRIETEIDRRGLLNIYLRYVSRATARPDISVTDLSTIAPDVRQRAALLAVLADAGTRDV